ARLVASELLSASPASILFVEWPEPWRWSTIKRDLMRKFARLHAIPFHVVTPSAQELADAAALQSRIGSVLAEMPLPCGVFAVTDILGAAAIGAAARGGLAVPGDIAVASVDDDPEICENCSPTLTSVRPNFHSLGFAAGRLLQRAIAAAAPIKAECEVVPPIGIVRRASTLALQRADTEAAGAMELIRREACSGLRPGDAAALFHTSRRAAELRFKAATGMTFGQAILERRLAAACDYLRSGNATIAAIADFCGWNSDLAFRKAFKAQFSIPPTRWASRARQF
ncbi:MAG: substrate-binding domain-containing protein, partial [Kiritimatiellae bacterium]|nr:substrate-binding domain-containing protein [Kiritimatiellia bacterium]